MQIKILAGLVLVLFLSCQQRDELEEYFTKFAKQVPLENFEQKIKKQTEFTFNVHYSAFKIELIHFNKDPAIEKKFQSLDLYKYHKEPYFHKMIYIAFIRYVNHDEIELENIISTLKDLEKK